MGHLLIVNSFASKQQKDKKLLKFFFLFLNFNFAAHEMNANTRNHFYMIFFGGSGC